MGLVSIVGALASTVGLVLIPFPEVASPALLSLFLAAATGFMAVGIRRHLRNKKSERAALSRIVESLRQENSRLRVLEQDQRETIEKLSAQSKSCSAQLELMSAQLGSRLVSDADARRLGESINKLMQAVYALLESEPDLLLFQAWLKASVDDLASFFSQVTGSRCRITVKRAFTSQQPTRGTVGAKERTCVDTLVHSHPAPGTWRLCAVGDYARHNSSFWELISPADGWYLNNDLPQGYENYLRSLARKFSRGQRVNDLPDAEKGFLRDLRDRDRLPRKEREYLNNFLDDTGITADLGAAYRNTHFSWRNAMLGDYPYRSTLVWPVRLASGNPAAGKYSLPGFLCVDSEREGAFVVERDLPLGQIYAPLLFIALTLHRRVVSSQRVSGLP